MPSIGRPPTGGVPNVRDCQGLVLFNSRHTGDFLVAGVARVSVSHKRQFSSSYVVWNELA